MRIDDDRGRRRRRGGAARLQRPATDATDAGEAAEERREKVIVRSDGTVTYVGKDMAYQLWKFGLLGKDFHYRVFEERPAAALVDELRRRQPAATGAPRSAAPRGSATSSTRGSRTCRSCSSRRSRRSGITSRRRIRFTTRTRWWRCRTPRRASSGTTPAADRRSAVRRGLRTQGTGRQGRRPARPPHRQGRRGSREAQRRSSRRKRHARSPQRSPPPRCATSW